MLQVIQTKSVAILETIVERLEQYEQLQKRPRVFAKESDAAAAHHDALSSNSSHSDQGDDVPVDAKQKLKQLSFELIDIGLHTSQLGLELVQSSEQYQQVQERILGLEQQVREGGVQLYKFIADNVYTPLSSNLYVIYDKSTHVLSFLMEVLLEHQQKLREYLAKNYENVTVLIRDNWMRLDFNKDGHVSIDDIKQGAGELLEFLRNFDYLTKATEIKSSLYQEAIKYMKKDIGSSTTASGTPQPQRQPDEISEDDL
jgi:hypothetical protein